MLAEEYLEMMKFKGHIYDLVTMANAEVAVELARKEEQEKAIEKVKMAYKNALYECENNKGTYKSPIYIFEDLMKDCDKIINE